MAESKRVCMKLLIDKETKRVLLGEAGKDCVDFLVYLLSLPVATIVGLLRNGGRGMVGSLGKLYDSIENLNDSYLQSGKSKNSILSPPLPCWDSRAPLLLTNSDDDVTGVNINNNRNRNNHNQQGNDGGGFVKGVVTYTVTDDLEIKPMSSISCITSLNQFKIKDLSLLEERVVALGMNEGLGLLKASFQSKQVLTDVFVKGIHE
ncbi:uncharacterized protein LOC127259470 [Andrographis paniculata]|uniref:uncharacterized protein LOC127259470 n=1 Tax=Andrographis paniculata TaxID=175694 RepID=UPI0021E7E287|nr:uncharacterized protein LOC127259470 [Andrographis paniculata]